MVVQIAFGIFLKHYLWFYLVLAEIFLGILAQSES